MREAARHRSIRTVENSKRRIRNNEPGLLGSRFVSGVLVAIAALGRSRGAACSNERDDRPARFESALVDLSRIFYYAEGRVRYAALRDELRFVERYLGLQALRFEDRLTYRVAADERALDLAVPRLSLFRSLERAVADALELSTGPAFIAVEAVQPAGCGLALHVARGPSSRGPMKEVDVVRIAARRPP